MAGQCATNARQADMNGRTLARRTSSAVDLRAACDEFVAADAAYRAAKEKRDQHAAEMSEAFENRLAARDAIAKFTTPDTGATP